MKTYNLSKEEKVFNLASKILDNPKLDLTLYNSKLYRRFARVCKIYVFLKKQRLSQ